MWDSAELNFVFKNDVKYLIPDIAKPSVPLFLSIELKETYN